MKKSQKSKCKGNKFEKIVVKTINSGGLWFDKGDIKYKDFLIECKFTEKKGFRITLTLLEKIWREALDVSKDPLIVIGIRRNEKEIFTLTGKLEIENK